MSINPIYAAAVVFPALCALGVQFLGQGVTQAQASLDPVTFDEFSGQVMEFEREREDRVAYMDARSPFYFEPIEQQPEPGPRIIVRDKRPGQPAPPAQLPGVSVTSILPHPKNPLAIIDGKPRRIGDTLDSGWTVMSINASDFTVTLRHSSGEQIREGLKKN